MLPAMGRGGGDLNINYIDHLPDAVLVEILCRLADYKSVFQCNCVSKRWLTLISDSYLVSRFVCMKSSDPAQALRTLINSKGEEFLARMSSSHKPLTRLFQSLVSLHGLEQEPVVVGTYNDLVLCCTGKYYQRDYYICNPHTQQSFALPRIPECKDNTPPLPEGFICDLPYYNNYKKDETSDGHILQLNTEYRCKVVRLICVRGDDDDDDNDLPSSEFKVQIFSSETGEWKEVIVSSPQNFRLWYIIEKTCYTNARNGMLYWMHEDDFFFGLNPFMMDINNSSSTGLSCTTATNNSTSTTDHSYYTCHFIDISVSAAENGFIFSCLGEYGGRLRIYDYNEEHLLLCLGLE